MQQRWELWRRLSASCAAFYAVYGFYIIPNGVSDYGRFLCVCDYLYRSVYLDATKGEERWIRVDHFPTEPTDEAK